MLKLPGKTASLICLFGAALGLSGCVSHSEELSSVQRGQQIAESRCAQCHAIGMADESAHPEAPALRDLYKHYSLEDVRRSFSRGIHIGHPDMPTFHLDQDENESLLLYLLSIDPCAQPSSDQEAMDRCFSPL